jgi:hypothetical protein
VPRLKESRAVPLLPLWAFVTCSRVNFILPLPITRTLCISVSKVVRDNFAGDKIENNEMGGTCSSDGGGERRVQGFGVDHWEYPGVDGRII